MRIDMRPAALACANEACRNMSGPLDLDAMVRHFEKVGGLPTNPFVVGPATIERVFRAAGLTDMSNMQAVLNAVEAALTCPRAAPGKPWVPQIGERVEVTDETPGAEDWRGVSIWVAGVHVHHSGDGLNVTVSEEWPIPARTTGRYLGLADDFRIGAATVADMLRPLQPPAGER